MEDGEEDPEIYDDWGNIYYHIDEQVLESYTWQGQPLSNKAVRQLQGFSKQAQVADTAREDNTEFNAPTPRTKPPWE